MRKINFPLPLAAAALLIGICSTIYCPQIPTQLVIYALLGLAIIIIVLPGSKYISGLGLFIFGFALMGWHINVQYSRAWPTNLENIPITLTGTIISLIEETSAQKVRFLFKLAAKDQTVQVTWDKPQHDLRPGDEWSLTLKLKRPRNYANPGSFDTEKFYFQQRIVAIGYVMPKGEHNLIAQHPLRYPIQNLRQELFSMLAFELHPKQFMGIIVALILGSKAAISTEQMQLLQNTGTAHLMAISGMHIGMIAGMIFAVLRFGWRFTAQSWRRFPAPWVAAWGALAVSVYYALLAGFSIATQRSLIMIGVLLAGLVLKRKISSTNSYCLALIIVLLWDPFAVLSIGFWLSFVAVGFLLYAFGGRTTTRNKWYSWQRWLKPQIVISLGLLPISLLFFAQTSICGPVANLIAIPWVCCTVVPLSLAAVLMWPIDHAIAVNLLKFAEYNFSLLWPILEKFARIPVFSWHPPQEYLGLLFIVAFLGAVWLLMPRGLPGRYWGVICFVPWIFVPLTTIEHGAAEFTLLDVGQGLATVVQTKNHVLVYDTGAKLSADFDLGSRVVAPFLQHKGIKQINQLMISHADNDHIGGAVSILQKFPTQEILISDQNYLREYGSTSCHAGQSWTWDGVDFFVLHPVQQRYYKKRNDRSCVLMVRAGKHKVLLTGDIESKAEQQLIANYSSHLQADILLVPHHGSKTSSSEEFIHTVNPKYALIPVGYKNQYGHPKEQVLQRYTEHGVQILSTELDGAISFKLGQERDLVADSYRRHYKMFWNQHKS